MAEAICGVCQKTFCSPRGVLVHAGRMHRKQKPDDTGSNREQEPDDTGSNRKLCKKCGKTYCNAKGLSRHMKNVHKTAPVPRRAPATVPRKTLPKKHTCPFCMKKFQCIRNLKLHTERSHIALSPFLCQVCGGYFLSEEMMKAHEKTHSVFDSGINLTYPRSQATRVPERQAMASVSSEVYSCDTCGSLFTNKSALEVHRTTSHFGAGVKATTSASSEYSYIHWKCDAVQLTATKACHSAVDLNRNREIPGSGGTGALVAGDISQNSLPSDRPMQEAHSSAAGPSRKEEESVCDAQGREDTHPSAPSLYADNRQAEDTCLQSSNNGNAGVSGVSATGDCGNAGVSGVSATGDCGNVGASGVSSSSNIGNCTFSADGNSAVPFINGVRELQTVATESRSLVPSELAEFAVLPLIASVSDVDSSHRGGNCSPATDENVGSVSLNLSGDSRAVVVDNGGPGMRRNLVTRCCSHGSKICVASVTTQNTYTCHVCRAIFYFECSLFIHLEKHAKC